MKERPAPGDFLVRALASGLGAGYSPLVPGTVGTLAAIPLLLFLSRGGFAAHLAGLLAVTAAGIPLASRMTVLTGRKDPKPVVIDEIAGYLVATLGFPPSLPSLAAAFILFRFFDVAKPFPIRRLERLPGGWGIVADDLMAGAYAWICLFLMDAAGLLRRLAALA